MKSSSRTARRYGFTLIELLVVIAIIVILMGLLLGVIPAIKENARRLEAQNTEQQIVTAATAYYTEYAKFPPLVDPTAPPSDPNSDQYVGDTAMGASLNNNALFYTLRNIPDGPNADYACNPRKVVFFEGKAATVSSSDQPRGGFYDKTSMGGSPDASKKSCLYDPWGAQYGVILDTNNDDQIDLKGVYNDFSGVGGSGNAPRKKVGAFAMGKDGKLGKKGDNNYRSSGEKSDDVISWE